MTARPAQRKNRSGLIGILSCLIGAFAAMPSSSAEPYIPETDATIVETLPTAGNKPAQELRRLNAALLRAPNILELAMMVAQKDLELGRADMDPRYDGRAEAALAPWINLPDPPMPVRFVRAVLRQRVHNFSAALADLDAVLAADPDDREARLVRSVVYQVRGDFPAALKDCETMGPPTDRVVAICAASVHSLTGLGPQALDEIKAACSGAFTLLELPTKLWALTIAAETSARLGRNDEADVYFHAAFDLQMRDPYLLGAYADFLLDQSRAAEVETLLQREVRVDPLLLRLALAEQIQHRPSLDAHVTDLAERFAAARRRGDIAHRREESRFELELLGQPQIALKLAQDNWTVQHEPADARVLLASAAAAKSPQAAAAVLKWIAETGLQDIALTRLAANFPPQD